MSKLFSFKKAIKQVAVPNKYNMTVSKISQLIVNRDRLPDASLEREEDAKRYAVSGKTSNEIIPKHCFWLHIYDEDAVPYPGMVRLEVLTDWLRLYTFENFYCREDIKCEEDICIQEMILAAINKLIDDGVLLLRG